MAEVSNIRQKVSLCLCPDLFMARGFKRRVSVSQLSERRCCTLRKFRWWWRDRWWNGAGLPYFLDVCIILESPPVQSFNHFTLNTLWFLIRTVISSSSSGRPAGPAVGPATTHGSLEDERAQCIMGNCSITRNQPELVHFHLSSSRPAWEKQKHGLLSEEGGPWIFCVGGVKGQVLMEHSNPDGQV